MTAAALRPGRLSDRRQPLEGLLHRFEAKWPALAPRLSSVHVLFGEFCNPMSEARHFSAGIVLMEDAVLCGSHDGRLCRLESRQCRLAITALDRFFDFAD